MNKLRTFLIIFIVVIFVAKSSFALNVQNFHPLIGQRNQGMTVYGSQGLSKGQFEVGLFANYDDNPLEFSLPPDDRVNGIVNRYVTLDAMASFGFTDWFTFHFNFPFNPYSNVEQIATYLPTNDASLGDPKFSATLSLFKKYDDNNSELVRGGLALIPFFTIPLNNQDDFFGNESWTGGGLIAFDSHLGKRHYFAMNLGARFRERERILNLVVSHEMLGGASYVYRISCKQRIDLVFEGQASTTFRKFIAQEISSPAEVFFALRKESQSKHWQWTLGAGRGINNGYGAPDYHVIGGLSYLFFGRNQIKPHCCDPKLKKEPVVEIARPVEQKLGSIHIEVVNSNGEPIVTPIQIFKDTSMIVQNQTNRIKQPLEIGSYRIILPQLNVQEDSLEVVSGQETYKKIVIPVAAKPLTIIKYIEPIYFDSNKDSIKPESYPALDEVFSIIKEFPNISSIQIEAHTDSQGKDAYNLDLSNRRAYSAREYLVKKGVDSTKIKTTGFGEVKPIANNATSEGRAKNRRVEFLIQSPNQSVKIIQKN